MTDVIYLIIDMVIGANLEVLIMSLFKVSSTSINEDGDVYNGKQQQNKGTRYKFRQD